MARRNHVRRGPDRFDADPTCRRVVPTALDEARTGVQVVGEASPRTGGADTVRIGRAMRGLDAPSKYLLADIRKQNALT